MSQHPGELIAESGVPAAEALPQMKMGLTIAAPQQAPVATAREAVYGGFFWLERAPLLSLEPAISVGNIGGWPIRGVDRRRLY
jgi:hypothetical protein